MLSAQFVWVPGFSGMHSSPGWGAPNGSHTGFALRLLPGSVACLFGFPVSGTGLSSFGGTGDIGSWGVTKGSMLFGSACLAGWIAWCALSCNLAGPVVGGGSAIGFLGSWG